MRWLDRLGFGAKLATITAAGFVARAIGLSSYLPTRDDLLSVYTADLYMATGQPYPIMPFHPVLRNILTWASMEMFGRGAIGAKLPSLLAGTLLIAAVGLMVRCLGSGERVALIAAGLVAADPLLIDYSRQVIQEGHVALFAVTGVWLGVEHLRRSEQAPWWWLVLSGLSFGLAISSKAYAFAPLAVVLVAALASAYRRRSLEDAAFAASSLIVLPFAVYLATYLPWFGRGYDFGEWIAFQAATVEAMVSHTKPLVGFFANSRPALWFVVPLYSYADFAMTLAGPQLAVAVGNPVTWLAVLPAAGWSLVSAERQRRDALLLVLFAVTYLPLALSPRPIWVLSAVAVAPFALSLVATALGDLLAAGRWRAVVAYLAAAAVAAALLYPAATGSALRVGYLQPLVRSLGLEQTHGFGVDR